MQKTNFIDFLKVRLNSELPGMEAHNLMVPQFQGASFRNFKPSKDAKQSAVLIYLCPDAENNDINILLTLRSSRLNSHSGQISFPGGRADENESPEETAIRETYEEIGIQLSSDNLIGRLSTLFVPPSKSIITPVLAFGPFTEKFNLNFDEVEETFYTSITFLSDKQNLKKEIWKFNDNDVEVPLWNVHHKTPLWGATAIILSELIYLFDEYKRMNY